MSANITDLFTKASSMNGYYPRVATVTAARQAGAQILQCDDLSTWATDTPVHFSTYTVRANGEIDPATQTDWKGIVSGNNITNLTRIAGAADSGNASNDRVELNPTIGWLNDLINGILVSHNQSGTLKDSSVSTNAIANGAITAEKIASGSMPVITMTNIDPGEGSTLEDDHFIGVYSSEGYEPVVSDFSTSETNTGVKWIDGKNIYKKTLDCGTLPNNTTKDIPYNISDFSRLLKLEGYTYSSTNNQSFSIPHVSSLTIDNSIGAWIEGSNLRVRTGADRSSYTETNITLYYTKIS